MYTDTTAHTFFASNIKSGIGGIDAFTKLMLHLDNNVTDSELTPKTVTNNGVTFDSTNFKFGGFSGLWTEGGSQYLSVGASADWVIGSGDYTIDFWYKMPVSPTANGAPFNYSTGVPGTFNGWGVYIQGGTSLNFFMGIGGAILINISSGAINDNTFHHVAFVKSGSTYLAFKDGTQNATSSNATTPGDPGLALEMGRGQAGGSTIYITANMDEIRISKGIARWTSNFTPPTAPYSK